MVDQTLVLKARDMAQGGNIAAALALLSQARESGPVDPQVWQLASALAVHVRDWAELQRIASSWIISIPDSVAAWKALSQSHFEESRFNEAIDAFTNVLALEPGNASHLISAARLATAGQQYDLARNYLNAAEVLTPDSGEVLFALSRLHHQTGNLAAAEQYCRRSIAARPGLAPACLAPACLAPACLAPAYLAPAYTALGVLTEGCLDKTEIATVAQMVNDASLHAEYRAMLGFTLGNALDRQGLYDKAFAAWQQANLINSRISEQEGIFYNAEQHEADISILEQLFADPVSVTINAPADVRPIFIVGMPRSGTTLIESILASHSQVVAAGELPALLDIHEDLINIARRQGIAAARATLTMQADCWRARYLAELPSTHGATHVVDKQPLNFRAVGLIRLLFPESPIIYTQRDAMDTGLSIYRHNFSKNWPCAHNLSDIGHYFRVHSEIVALWQRRFPNSIYVAAHAALVSNPEKEICQLLAFASLNFEDTCLTPHKTKRSVVTFSAVQVQRPVSASYSGRAARYSIQLAPLRAAMARD